MGKFPTTFLYRPTAVTVPLSSLSQLATQTSFPSTTITRVACQIRDATFIARPRRAYTFMQLVQLSDGSTYTHRTTSPAPLFRTAKDSRNHVVWQPSEKSLRNVEIDEAGKLAAFRERFGRSWDADAKPAPRSANKALVTAQKQAGQPGGSEYKDADLPDMTDIFGDLLSKYSANMKHQVMEGATAKEQDKLDKKKKKK